MIGPLVLTIASVFKSAGLNSARQALTGASKDFNQFASSIGKAAGAFGAFQGIAGAREFMVGAVESANLFERNILGLQQVFETATPALKNFITQVEDYGLSQGQAAQASVFLGSVLKQYGIATFEAASQTERLVTLAQDLATTYGYDVQEALVAITALFRGEYDPIEKFGVAMKQSEINAYLAARGLNDLEGAELNLAQAQARLALLYERSADAAGAFGRASDTLYASQSKLSAVVQNLQIAFGQPLQGPIAEVLNLFTEVAKNAGPQLVEVSTAIGNVIETVGPSFAKVGELFLNLTALLQPLIELLGGLLDILSGPVNLALDAINGALSIVIKFFDVWSATTQAAALELTKFMNGPAKPFIDFLTDVANMLQIPKNIEGLGIAFANLNDQLDRNIQNANAVTGNITSFDNGAKAMSVSMRGSAYATRDARKAQEETAAAGKKLTDSLKAIGAAADTTSGKTSGLTQIFAEIEKAAAQSKAKEALEGLGLSAELIEKVLTQPNWEAIFKRISRLAYLTSIDVSKVFSITALGQIGAEKAEIAEYLKTAFKTEDTKAGGGSKTEKPRDTIKAMFNEMRDEVNKQAASIKLAAMGASEGLIDLILGNEDWSKLWQQIKTGVISLKDLQNQFNNTAAGVKELEDALQAARDEAQAYIDKQQEESDRLKRAWDEAKDRAEDFKKTIAEIANIKILPTQPEEIGQFEQQILDFIENIQNALKQGFDSKAIFEADYLALKAYANQEAELLQSIARQRDDLANRYKLSKALIEEYESAFKSAASLTTLFGKLKGETEKRTVTEITRSVAQLTGSLKEFNITVTREYEETIDKVVNKSEGLLNGFRDMATKARSFAENLRKLKDMGLNGELFNQLVQAGVEAGGETAQALVEGGDDTIKEINDLFDEISVLGANLGLEAATELYSSGIDMVDGLIDGILSQQSKLEATAQSLADAFNAKFQASVAIATDKPVAAAKADFENVVVPKLENIDVAGLAQLNSYLENAGKALNSVTDPFKAAGIDFKINVVEALKKDILAGAQFDLSGIRTGLSSEALLAAAVSTGSTTVNNYYTTIQPGDRLAQNNTVESLQTFANANGNIGSWVAL